MNDIEDRLRAALRDRATTYEASPNAWMEVQRRTNRSHRLRPWLLALVPMALAALIVPFLLTGGQDGDVTTTTPASPEDLWTRANEGKTPLGEPLTMDNPGENRQLRLWFVKNAEGTTELCTLTEYATGGAISGCNVSHSSPPAFAGTTDASPKPSVMLDYGVASQDVQKVVAVAKDGSKIDGMVHRPNGAPAPIWTVSYPTGTEVTGFEFINAQGDTFANVERPEYQTTEAANGKQIGPKQDMSGGLSVRLYEVPDRELIWLANGLEVGLHLVRPQDLATGTDAIWPVDLRFRNDHWFGAAKPGTAKVVVESVGGKLEAESVTQDPWGLGLTLFSGALTDGRDLSLEGYKITGYDANGKETWSKENGPVEPLRYKDHPPIGGTFMVGGVELWFSKVTLADGKTADGLCHSYPRDGKPVVSCDPYVPPTGPTHARRLPDIVVGDKRMAVGIAGAGITQVLRDDKLAGQVHQTVGAPLKIWTVDSPKEFDDFDLRDANKDLGIAIGGVAPNTCTTSPPVGVVATLPAGTTTYQDGCIIIWTKDGQRFSSKWSSKDYTVKNPGSYSYGETFSGVVIGGTARVEMIRKDGTRLSADTVADPWGLGIALFAVAAGEGKDIEGSTTVGYDSAGKKIWQMD